MVTGKMYHSITEQKYQISKHPLPNTLNVSTTNHRSMKTVPLNREITEKYWEKAGIKTLIISMFQALAKCPWYHGNSYQYPFVSVLSTVGAGQCPVRSIRIL